MPRYKSPVNVECNAGHTEDSEFGMPLPLCVSWDVGHNAGSTGKRYAGEESIVGDPGPDGLYPAGRYN